MPFSETLKSLRTARGLTQEQLAEFLSEKTGQDFQRTSITKWERGKHEPTAYTLKLIAEAFDVTVDYLIGTNYQNDADDLEQQLQNRPLLKKLVNHLLHEDDEKIRAICLISGIDLGEEDKKK